MNKFGIVLGAAAIVTFAGCKDPDYKHNATPSQDEVKSAETTPETSTSVESVPVATCQCLPGTKHESPCKCGASDCKCIVEKKSAPLPVEVEYTEYIVQNGDFLSKISQRYNVTLASIRRLNPSIKKDVIRVGQRIKLPGKIDVGVQQAPVKASVKPVKKSAAAYTGATKEYVVKNGDTLGSVAYGNGINIRQLKQLNGLTSDTLKVGQKLKIPADKVVKVASAAKKVESPAVEKKAATAPVSATAEVSPAAVTEEKKEAAPVVVEEKKEESAPAPAATATYVVQEGDDMTGVSIRWGVSAAQIRELNNLGENDQLVPGQIIKLPAEAQQ